MRYKTRQIKFKELFEINGWKIKIYTISELGKFEYPIFYNNVLDEIPVWLNMKNSFNSNDEKIAFLILHAGTEGIFSLINWWVGQNMLNTNIFITNPAQPFDFRKISGDGLAPCVWEIEVINHERISWTENILKKMPNPNYLKYLEDVINVEI